MAILKNQTKWEDLYYYRKSLVLYEGVMGSYGLIPLQPCGLSI